MNESSLNFARKWRPKSFDTLVGQELAVRLIKNSLYRQKLFPVYLFAGQRGCGKTTLARIFATAINCSKIKDFLRTPLKISLPCLTCKSCLNMQSGEHPDFCEMDAASHTGVDNIRSLIESALLMPGLGGKKIYLIDEAHMLTKSSFNAFLKILEEPPKSVIFILATTNPQKIIDTVRSRCFQIFLDPISTPELIKHLENICKNEKITYENEALQLIAQESEGSARDALNLLEQISIAYDNVQYDNTLKILGDVPYDILINLIETVQEGKIELTLKYIQEQNLRNFSAPRLWKKTVTLFRELIFLSQGAKTTEALQRWTKKLEKITKQISPDKFLKFLELLYNSEPVFLKTQTQHTLIETVFIEMTNMCKNTDLKNINPKNKEKISQNPETNQKKTQNLVAAKSSSKSSPEDKTQEPIKKATGTAKNKSPEVIKTTIKTEKINLTKDKKTWNEFLKKIENKKDPLVNSIFKQGTFKNKTENKIEICFDKKLCFFEKLLQQTQNTWNPILSEIFDCDMVLSPKFEQISHDTKKAEKITNRDTNNANSKETTPDTCSSDTCSSDTCSSDTCSSDTCSSDTCSSDTCSGSVILKQAKTFKNTTTQKIVSNTTLNTNKALKAMKRTVNARILDLNDTKKWKQVHSVLKAFPGTALEEN